MEKNKKNGQIVTISIPKKIVNKEVIQNFIQINKTTKINGFRKGKTPLKIIQEKYGNKIYYDVFNDLMQKFFYEFTKKEKIKIIGIPKYFMHEIENEKEHFKYSVNYEVYPNFQIKNINLIEVNKIIVKITNEDIKKSIEKKQKNVWNTVNKATKINNRVTINYRVYKNNEEIKKYNENEIKFVISKNSFISELNEKIINRFVNDVFFLKVNFSQFHPIEELKNQDIIFKIKILKIEEKKENSEIEKIKKNTSIKLDYKIIKNKIVEETNNLTRNHLHRQIIEKLIENNPIKIPSVLLKEETRFLYKNLIGEYKEKKDNILEKKYHVNLKEKAEKRLRIKLIIEKIINDEKLVVNEEQVKLLIKKISLNYKKPLDIIKMYENNNTLKQTIKNIELEMQVMQFLEKKIKIIKKNWTLDEVINYKWEKNENFI